MNCTNCRSIKVRKQGDVAWGIPWESHKDEKGMLHRHDPNKHFIDYKCQCGHIFEISYFPVCECGWTATMVNE